MKERNNNPLNNAIYSQRNKQLSEEDLMYDEFNYLLDNHITALGVKEIDNGDLSYFEKKARLIHKNVSELNTQSLEDFFG